MTWSDVYVTFCFLGALVGNYLLYKGAQND